VVQRVSKIDPLARRDLCVELDARDMDTAKTETAARGAAVRLG